MVGVWTYILKVKGSNLTSGVCVVNNGRLTQYSFNPLMGAHVDYVAYILRLGF
jgi:hypothetical protein